MMVRTTDDKGQIKVTITARTDAELLEELYQTAEGVVESLTVGKLLKAGVIKDEGPLTSIFAYAPLMSLVGIRPWYGQARHAERLAELAAEAGLSIEEFSETLKDRWAEDKTDESS